MNIENGLDLEETPEGVISAYRRGCEIKRDTYSDVKCRVELVDFDATNWQIKVTRVSDSDVTTDLIPK